MWIISAWFWIIVGIIGAIVGSFKKSGITARGFWSGIKDIVRNAIESDSAEKLGYIILYSIFIVPPIYSFLIYNLDGSTTAWWVVVVLFGVYLLIYACLLIYAIAEDLKDKWRKKEEEYKREAREQLEQFKRQTLTSKEIDKNSKDPKK